MTYVSSSSGTVVAAKPARGVQREYETVVAPLGELSAKLGRFVRDPRAYTGTRKEIDEAQKALGELLDRDDVAKIVNAWWGVSEEADGEGAIVSAMRQIQVDARTALRQLKAGKAKKR